SAWANRRARLALRICPLSSLSSLPFLPLPLAVCSSRAPCRNSVLNTLHFRNNPRDLGCTCTIRNGRTRELSRECPMEQYNLCGLSSFPGWGFRSICRPTAPAPLEIKGSALMHKAVFAAALAVGLVTAPMSQFVSSAATQQQEHREECKDKEKD